jgi:hypothetical protein
VNLKEGTRRLALLLGAAGAILGGFASYLELKDVLNQRVRHDRFEQLAASDIVRQERQKLKMDLPRLTNPTVTDSSGWESGVYPIATGIKTIHWGKDYGVYSIETEDGLTFFPTPTPAAYNYLLIVLWPCLGFFIPWGAIRAIGWVGAGLMKGEH